jgi:hypothetical protein
MTTKVPLPPLSNPITDKPVSLIWGAYFSGLKNYIDTLDTAIRVRLHNALDQLQGGSTTERYHLTQAEHDNTVQIPIFNGDETQFISGAATFLTPEHEFLLNIQGGADGEHYHLNATQYANLTPIGYDNDVNHFLNGQKAFSAPSHNATINIQGGAVGDYQHLTTTQKNSIANMNSLIFGYMSLGL